MSSKEQLCNVCGRWVNYPNEDMVRLKDLLGVAHLSCAWDTRNEGNNVS